ncbi:hypothetical protein BH11PSE11_BH11PSE11_30740 [soil metagenome]
MNPAKFLLLAVLLPSLSVAADQPPIGRLMFTPAERAALDVLRQKGDDRVEELLKPAAPILPVEKPPAEQITLDGFVTRSNGSGTTWINGVARQEREVSQGLSVLQQRAKAPVIAPVVHIQLSSGKKLSLKPGQTFDAESSKVIEVYEDLPPVAAPPKK